MLVKFDIESIRAPPPNTFSISDLMLHALNLDYLLIWR